MKKIIAFMFMIAMIAGGYGVNDAICWDCVPKKCAYDTECGSPNCWCYKAQYQIYGVCVSK